MIFIINRGSTGQLRGESVKNEIASLALNNGIVGAGGAGFPTQIKLNCSVEHIVINGAECEPLIAVDEYLMTNYASSLMRTLEEMRVCLGAKDATIAIKAKHHEAVDALKRAIKAFGGLRLFELGNFYPAGDEVVLVYEVTGRNIPHGGIPLDVQTVVVNVETLWNLCEAREGRALTHKWVSVGGAAARPGIYRVALGVSIDDVLALAGGSLIEDYRVVIGGPMMGKLADDLSAPITKTTKGLLVLPMNSPVITLWRRPLETIFRHAKSLCCQCRLCADLCPRALLGYHCTPNRSILAACPGENSPADAILQAMQCSECGVCDLFACPMGLSPRRVNAFLKQQLAQARVANPQKGTLSVPSQWRRYRRINTERLISRLGLEAYYTPPVLKAESLTPRRVCLPLCQHIGRPPVPEVDLGDAIETGQLIARVAQEGAVSSNLFSPIAGRVTAIDSNVIQIESFEVTV
jgi:Na+-translocating ferredoxin:NAD+ oxidoreductase RnfC subunit